MFRTILSPVIFTTVLLVLFAELCFADSIPASALMEKDPLKKEKRLQWINEMNRIEPDMDWRIIESELRNLKNAYRQEKVRTLIKEGKYEKALADEETLANGKIKGRWSERGSVNQSGRMHTADIDFERNLIFAASSGGNIWRGTLDGENWVCLNDRINFKDIRTIKVLNTNDKKRLLVVRNSPAAVMLSDDDGTSWSFAKGLEIPANWGYMKRGIILDNDKKTIYVLVQEWDYDIWAAKTSIYISENLGDTFQRVYSTSLSSSQLDIWAPKYNSESLYLVFPDSLYTFDSNANIINRNYLQFNPPTTTTAIYDVMLGGSFNNKDSVLVAMLNRNTEQGRFSSFFSIDLQGNIEYHSELQVNPFMMNSFALSNLHSDNLFFGSVELYRKLKDFPVWERVNNWWDYYPNPLEMLHADICGIDFFIDPQDPEKEIMLISTDGGIYKSDNYTLNVENISLHGLNVSQYYSTYTHQENPNNIFAGSQDQGFQRALNQNDGILEFEQTISGDYGHLCSSDKGKHLWSVYPGWTLLYIDLASDNTKSAGWTFQGKGWLWMPPIIADPDNPKASYIAAGGVDGSSNLWRLEYDGEKIDHTMLPYDFKQGEPDARLTSIAFSEIKSNYLYAMDGMGGFYTSSNKGQDWGKSNDFKGPTPHYFYGSSIVPAKTEFGTLFIGGSGYSNPGAFMSRDNGQSFIPIDSGLPKTLIYDMAISDDDQFLFAATQIGPYMYDVKDMIWYDISGLSAPDQTYWSVEYVPQLRTARFGTYGRGIWDFTITDIVSVEDCPKNRDIAQKINMEAFPNPFTNHSTIKLNIPASSNISIRIYDLEGHIVRNLFDGYLNGGINEFKWDGRSDNGFLLPKGTYICVASGLNNCAFKKIIKK